LCRGGLLVRATSGDEQIWNSGITPSAIRGLEVGRSTRFVGA
jgi:hypothetical protein